MLNPQDMQRLIDPHHRRGARRAGRGRPVPRQCTCHAATLECCPDRLRGVLDAGASRIGVHAAGGAPAAWPG